MKMTPPAISSFLLIHRYLFEEKIRLWKTGLIINYINQSFDKTEQEQETEQDYPSNSKSYL